MIWYLISIDNILWLAPIQSWFLLKFPWSTSLIYDYWIFSSFSCIFTSFYLLFVFFLNILFFATITVFYFILSWYFVFFLQTRKINVLKYPKNITFFPTFSFRSLDICILCGWWKSPLDLFFFWIGAINHCCPFHAKLRSSTLWVSFPTFYLLASFALIPHLLVIIKPANLQVIQRCPEFSLVSRKSQNYTTQEKRHTNIVVLAKGHIVALK